MKFRLCGSLILVSILPISAFAETPYRGPIIDAHAHLRTGDNDATSPTHSKGTIGLRALDAAAGISKSALIVIAGGGPDAVRAKNDALLAAVAADPTHFYAVASVHPADGDAAMAEIERLAARGVKFIKLHPNSQEFDVADAAVARVTEKCGALGMTVLFDSYDPFDPKQVGKFLKLTMSQPKTRFILAHMTFTRFREVMVFAMVPKLGGARNVWFDTSAIATTYANSPVEAELVWTMRQIGMDRILFGSDWPVDSPALALTAARQLGLTAVEQKLVFHDNIAGLIDGKPTK
jgi:uncharacterized protein